MICRNSLAAIAVVALLLGVEARAEDIYLNGDPKSATTRPLWELGVAAGGFYSPDYPAADKNSRHVIALPNLIYRGDFLRIGKDSIAKGVFFENEYTELNVSLAASFNVNSKDNNARQGMPDLDYLGEIGPQLKIRLGGQTELQLPVRAVFSTDFGRIDQRGFLFNPKLSHRLNNIFNSSIDMTSSIGSSFATKQLHAFFYQVEPEFATATRPVYEASGGYLGSDLAVGLSYSITNRVRAYAGGRVGYYGGTANEESPLFQQKINSSVYVGFIWWIYQSSTRVISK